MTRNDKEVSKIDVEFLERMLSRLGFSKMSAEDIYNRVLDPSYVVIGFKLDSVNKPFMDIDGPYVDITKLENILVVVYKDEADDGTFVQVDLQLDKESGGLTNFDDEWYVISQIYSLLNEQVLSPEIIDNNGFELS